MREPRQTPIKKLGRRERNFWMQRRGPQNRHTNATTARRDQNPGNERPEIPAETPYLASCRNRTVCKDWMVDWTKLAAPHAVIETSLRNSSQERNFLLQRPGGETGSFGSIAGAETALTREFGRHVFEIAALLRASQRLYNYRVWVVETEGTELPTPHPVIEPVSDTRVRNGNFRCRDGRPKWPHSGRLQEQRPH
jgi:hypothetical protein